MQAPTFPIAGLVGDDDRAYVLLAPGCHWVEPVDPDFDEVTDDDTKTEFELSLFDTECG
jgi:hypothetical protein